MTAMPRDVVIRVATKGDVDAIAVAHRDSIQSLGPAFYPPQAVTDWQEGIEPALYLNAIASGEVFFIAVEVTENEPVVLGFSSDYRIEGTTHGVSVYVRGSAARKGVGSALLGHAEGHARNAGATVIEIDASLVAETFYGAHGFVELTRGETRLTTGRTIECVFMRKELR
jgi:GNAT superfamily N-acetyltransferase